MHHLSQQLSRSFRSCFPYYKFWSTVGMRGFRQRKSLRILASSRQSPGGMQAFTTKGLAAAAKSAVSQAENTPVARPDASGAERWECICLQLKRTKQIHMCPSLDHAVPTLSHRVLQIQTLKLLLSAIIPGFLQAHCQTDVTEKIKTQGSI